MKFTFVIRLLGALFAIGFSHTGFTQTLNISTWNIEWLTINPQNDIQQSQRQSEDFSMLSEYFGKVNSDVLAFQEVDSIEAIRKIVGNEYSIVLSDRAQSHNKDHQFKGINQYTGFAIRRSVQFSNLTDLRINNGSHSKLRFASYITIPRSPLPELHILNVHLKAGCSGRYKNTNNCKVLKSQGDNIRKWIDQRESLNNSYIVLGDFNHNMSYPNDWLWNKISSNSNAVLTTRNTQAQCKVRSRNNANRTHQFRNLIDHIISSDDLKTKETAQHIFDKEDVLNYQLSDHCPVSTQVF